MAIPLVLSLAVWPLAGCGSADEGQAAGGDEEEVCPDTLLKGDSYALSSELDVSGQALGNQNVFTPETEEIYVTFYLSQDICCTEFAVRWMRSGEIVHSWSMMSYSDIGTEIISTSFPRPEGGFTKGEYNVQVFLGIVQLFDFTFTVV